LTHAVDAEPTKHQIESVYRLQCFTEWYADQSCTRVKFLWPDSTRPDLIKFS